MLRLPVSLVLRCNGRRATASGLLALVALCGAASAAPAPWYWWASKQGGQRVCAQHMPAQGWERAEGPYVQAGCRTLRPQRGAGGAKR